MIFAKTFLVADLQLLVTKEYEDDSFVINQITEIDGMRLNLILGYENEDNCDQVFEEYSQKDAEKIVKLIKSQITNKP